MNVIEELARFILYSCGLLHYYFKHWPIELFFEVTIIPYFKGKKSTQLILTLNPVKGACFGNPIKNYELINMNNIPIKLF